MRRGEEREGRGGGGEERKNRERGEKDARISISESTEGSIGTEKRNGKGGEGRGREGTGERGARERERGNTHRKDIFRWSIINPHGRRVALCDRPSSVS